MHTYKTEGIILKRHDFGEADRLLTIFTKHYGKIRVIAKGVRKTTSKKGPNLELFNNVRFFAAKGKNLDIVTETDLINSFAKLRKKLKRVALAYHACELVDRLTAERVEHQSVLEHLKSFLVSLDQKETVFQSEVTEFEVSLLHRLGFWPKGKSIENVDVHRFIESLLEGKLKSKKFLKDVV